MVPDTSPAAPTAAEPGERRRPRPGGAATRGAWTNVRLDDNEALPDWLRALAEPDRGPLALPQPGERRADEEPRLEDEHSSGLSLSRLQSSH